MVVDLLLSTSHHHEDVHLARGEVFQVRSNLLLRRKHSHVSRHLVHDVIAGRSRCLLRREHLLATNRDRVLPHRKLEQPRTVVPDVEADISIAPCIEHHETCNAGVGGRGEVRDIRAGAETREHEVLDALRRGEIVHRLARLDDRAFLERQRIPSRIAVADSRKIESQRSDSRRCERARDLRVKPARANPVHDARVDEYHRGLVGCISARMRLGDDADHGCSSAESDRFLARHRPAGARYCTIP